MGLTPDAGITDPNSFRAEDTNQDDSSNQGNESRDRDSNNTHPSQAATRTSTATRHLGNQKALQEELPEGGTHIHLGDVSCKSLVVELRGFEPLTFSLRTRRATSCAIAPSTGRW